MVSPPDSVSNELMIASGFDEEYGIKDNQKNRISVTDSTNPLRLLFEKVDKMLACYTNQNQF